MSTPIQTNTEELRVILQRVNALPEAGSGGIDTSDATATAADIASGKTAYVGGHKITGSVTSYDSQTGWNNVTPVVSGDNLRLSRDTNIPYLFRKGFYLGTPLSNLGDASASDVAKGKTFTSANGLKLTGTFEGGGLPDGFTAFASDTVTFANASYGPTIEHGLGVVPNFFYVVAEGSPTKADFTNYLIAHLAVKQTLEGNSGYYVTLSVSSAGVTLANTQVIKADDISNYFNETTIMPYGFFKQGKTYRWAAGVMDGIA